VAWFAPVPGKGYDMGIFGAAARRYLRGRGFNRRRDYGPVQGPGYGPRRRGRFGLWGPIPYYSTRTRRGSKVSVGGCCLPIPLLVVLSTGGALRALWRRVR